MDSGNGRNEQAEDEYEVEITGVIPLAKAEDTEVQRQLREWWANPTEAQKAVIAHYSEKAHERRMAAAEAKGMEDAGQIQARIGVWMSDLEITNEIIRVVGYERLEIIVDMLEDRLLAVDPKPYAGVPAYPGTICGPPEPSPIPVRYCAACARSGVGACDEFPDCQAGRR